MQEEICPSLYAAAKNCEKLQKSQIQGLKEVEGYPAKIVISAISPETAKNWRGPASEQYFVNKALKFVYEMLFKQELKSLF